MSQLAIRDGLIPSELSHESSASENDRKSVTINADSFTKHIFESKDKVDRRMLKIFKVREKLQTTFPNSLDSKKRPVNKKVVKFPAVDDFNPNKSAQVVDTAPRLAHRRENESLDLTDVV